ncbi:MAG: hypothetical protein MZW92_66465 [Comamonadaceae bacterium]|nr:hypothetical protein [Comamonadaceae bacterium]
MLAPDLDEDENDDAEIAADGAAPAPADRRVVSPALTLAPRRRRRDRAGTAGRLGLHARASRCRWARCSSAATRCRR